MGALLHLITKLTIQIWPFRSFGRLLTILSDHIKGFCQFCMVTAGHCYWSIPGCLPDCLNNRRFVVVVDGGALTPAIWGVLLAHHLHFVTPTWHGDGRVGFAPFRLFRFAITDAAQEGFTLRSKSSVIECVSHELWLSLWP